MSNPINPPKYACPNCGSHDLVIKDSVLLQAKAHDDKITINTAVITDDGPIMCDYCHHILEDKEILREGCTQMWRDARLRPSGLQISDCIPK